MSWLQRSYIACEKMTRAPGQVLAHLTSGPACTLPGRWGAGTRLQLAGALPPASDAHFLMTVEFLAGL